MDTFKTMLEIIKDLFEIIMIALTIKEIKK